MRYLIVIVCSLLFISVNAQTYNSNYTGAETDAAVLKARDSMLVAADTTTKIAMQWELNGKLDDADSTAIRTFSNSRYAYKNFMDASDGDPDSAIYVDATGQVGIGTTSPSQKLHVEGNIVVPNNNPTWIGLSSNSNWQVSNLGSGLVGQTNVHLVFDSDNNSSSNYLDIGNNSASIGGQTSLFRILESGNIGIGTTSPVSVLSIKNATPTFALYDSDIETVHATIAAIDSGAVTIDVTSDLGRVNYYGSDGDVWNTSINTSDQATFNGASGGYNFDALIITTGYKVNTHKIVSDSTLAAGLMYSGVFYVTGAYTVTLPAVESGMSATFITIGANAVSIDVNASDLQYLDGTALADGDKATNTSTTGDMIVFTYFDATGWYSASNGWTDGN